MDLNASNILLCLRYGIGDLVMELPALDRLREALPRATITGLGAEPAVEILDNDERLNKVVSIQRWGIQHLGDGADGASRRQFEEWLAAGHFEVILDPSHAANVVRQVIYQQHVSIYDSDSACIEIGLAQGMDGLSAVRHGIHQGWGLAVPASSHPAVRLHLHEIEWAGRFLQEKDLTRQVVALAPGASHELKRWPVEHFARLCRILVEELGADALVFCGSGEAKLAREFEEQTRDLDHREIVHNLHLRRVAALLSQCVLYVGNDSGLMHLAAAVGTPVVVLFGPTVPHLYLPTWVRSRAVASAVACPYRPRRAFGHPRCVLAGSCLIGTPCIHTIDPAQVCAAVQEEYLR
jgi:ADP-heptose:LPS heptosyltransferase